MGGIGIVRAQGAPRALERDKPVARDRNPATFGVPSLST
jgi:hypothetical protein